MYLIKLREALNGWSVRLFFNPRGFALVNVSCVHKVYWKKDGGAYDEVVILGTGHLQSN